MTMLETMISMVILTICCGMLTSTISATMQHNRIKRERQVAVEAARAILEDLHNVDFRDAFWMFNDSEEDDHEGGPLAPGAHFAVEGLRPLGDDTDGFVGEVLMPGSATLLLENERDTNLGLPRDLNGDLRIDDSDHSGDYLVLPVQVRIRWQGTGGRSEFKLDTMLADIRRGK